MTTTQPEPEPQRQRKRTSEPVCELSGSEMFDTFTKFDEIAAAKAFGEDIYTLRAKPFDFLRCLAFTHQRRLGLSHDDARDQAFGLTIAKLGDYFADEPDELDPDEPETAEGKDDSLTG